VLIYDLHSSGILCSSESVTDTVAAPVSPICKKTYAQSNFYACLWSLNGLKDPDRNISPLKMIQGTGNCSRSKSHESSYPGGQIANDPKLRENQLNIKWDTTGQICGKAVPYVTTSGAGEDVRSIHVTGDRSWGVAAQQQNETTTNSFLAKNVDYSHKPSLSASSTNNNHTDLWYGLLDR